MMGPGAERMLPMPMLLLLLLLPSLVSLPCEIGRCDL